MLEAIWNNNAFWEGMIMIVCCGMIVWATIAMIAMTYIYKELKKAEEIDRGN